MKSSSVIVYFDGMCVLCNRFADFLIKHDKSKNLQFSSLPTPQNSTIILAVGQKEYYKSDAAIRALAALGGAWNVTLLLLIIPKFLRDTVYDKVAQNRYRLFGRRDTCRIPSSEERDRFL